MPVAARVIANPFEYVNHSAYTAGKPGAVVLQSVNVASMVGCIQQIALLADYATEIFENLQQTTRTIHNRVCDISNRTVILNNQIPEIQRAVLERNVSTLVSSSKKSEVSPETQMLTPITRPRQISLRYELMNRIPNVHEMDQFLTLEELEAKGKCANMYSNPLFFFNEWVRVENARQQLIQEEKEKKKREKQERKALLKKEKEKRRTTLKPEKKKGLNWRDRYLSANVSSGQQQGTDTKKSLVVVTEEPEEEARPSRRTMLTEIWDKAGDNDEDEKPEEQEAQESQPPKPSGPAFSPPPPPPSFAPNVPPPPGPPSAPPPPMPPPAPPVPGAPLSPPPPLPPVPPPPRPPNPPSAPPTPSSEAYFTSSTSTVELDDLPPPPPRRPNPFGADSDRGSLLTSITQGKKLRTVEPPTAQEKTPKKPSLLDEISKGKHLKKVNLEEQTLKKQESKPATGLLGKALIHPLPPLRTLIASVAATGDAVANILARRKYIEESESDSDDSNDDDWG
jgi:hypothetical protein